MTHLTMDQLVQARTPGTEPGDLAAQAHLAECAACRLELERLHQRVARLKALPSLRPARDRWPAVRARLVHERRTSRFRRGALGGLALAASLALAVVAGRSFTSSPGTTATEAAISTARAQSATLENAIRRYEPESRVVDGHTARLADELEGRIAALDRRLEATQLQPGPDHDTQLLQLWRERVGLLDALVDVHVTRASVVGL
ncbi:MAG: hypothetical protein ACREL6_02145 [Gemmatimonadales bacterium]